jgi:recombination protein RecA
MAVKMDKAAIMKLCEDINRKEGEGTVFSVDSKRANLKIERWSTGIEDLDHIIGGGMPAGRVVEIFGPESAGKTSLLYHLCACHPLALDIPVEGTYDEDRAKVFCNRHGQLIVFRADTGEDALNKAIQFSEKGVPFVGIDSVPSLIPRDDIEKVLKSAQKDSIEEQRIGGTARLLNKYLPVLESIIEKSGTTLLFTNQVRDKMQAMLFGEKTDTPGGHKLKHSCSLRIQIARRAWIEIPNYDPRSSAAKERIGMIMKCRVVKSKVSNPMQECEVPMLFDRGFVSFSDLDKVKDEIADARAEQFGKRRRKR